MLEQRQHLLLNYFKTLSEDPAGNRTPASHTAVNYEGYSVNVTKEFIRLRLAVYNKSFKISLFNAVELLKSEMVSLQTLRQLKSTNRIP